MILVTGTKRSGTSMWMQILQAAGIEVIGDAFPKDWGDVLVEANPEGFYESIFRRGVFHATNPHPETGDYIHPDEARGVAVKVFIPGVVRSDLAFVERVLGTMRNWREYHGSLQRLYEMEHRNRNRLREQERPEPKHVSPALEWWAENYALIADHLTRRYPIHLMAYESVLAEPETLVREALGWLGRGDADAAVASVDPALRTHVAEELPEVPGIEPEVAEVFDELYARVRDRAGLDGPFIDRLNDLDERLQPRIKEEMRELRRHRARVRRERLRNAREHGEQQAAPDEPPEAQ
ncbi:MAG: hypothetical protein ACOCUS_05395 [Polyangiales bacterium]